MPYVDRVHSSEPYMLFTVVAYVIVHGDSNSTSKVYTPSKCTMTNTKRLFLHILCTLRFLFMKVNVYFLHFARVIDDAKYMLVMRVCVSVCGRMPALLHGPG